MYLRFIGTGDSFSKKMGNNSALFEWVSQKDGKFFAHNLLIDCPDSNYTGIKKIGFDYDSIQNIFITHLHADHINGLERMAYFRQIATPTAEKPNLYVPELLVQPLWSALQQGLMFTPSGKKELSDYFNVIEVADSFQVEDVEFVIHEAKHTPGMLCYGLEACNHFYFSGDSTINEKLLTTLSHSVKQIFHDCHLWDLPIQVHASVDDLANLSHPIKEKIIGMHYDDRFSDVLEVKSIPLAKINQIYLV